MKKLIIIGSGPAGISAALYAKMSGTDVSVITTEKTSLTTAKEIANYYGFENGVSGSELFEKGQQQAKNIGVNFIYEEVVGIGFEDSLTVTTTKDKHQAAAVIIATGKSRNKPNIKNFAEFEGKGVSYCALCDGFFYRNKNIAIIGAGDYAFNEYEYLKNVAASVTVFSDGEKITDSLKDIAVDEKIVEFQGNARLEKVVCESKKSYDFDGVFIAKGSADAGAIAKSLGILTEKGGIIIDEDGATNAPGIYAAGDCTGGLAQIAKSVYQGMKAGMSASKFIKKQ